MMAMTEAAGFALAVVMVWCSIRELHWSWPLAIASSALYFFVFRDSQLYGEASLQAVFAEEAPAIPLFPTPAWGEYNTSRITGFPTSEDPYATLSPNTVPDALLVLTRVRPRSAP